MFSLNKRVLVADSQELFGLALKDLLDRRLGVGDSIFVHSFEAATDYLSRDPSVSLALLALALPGMNGFAASATLRVAYPDLRLAVIADSCRREQILRALSVGVHGFLPRSLTANEMANALTAILNGQIYVPPAVSDLTHYEGEQGGSEDGLATIAAVDRSDTVLTTRQQGITRLISLGKTNKEIARSLGLAEGTVKVHVNAVFRALSVHNRAALASMLAYGRMEGSK